MNESQQKQLGSTLWAIADNYEEAGKKDLGSDYRKSELEIESNGENIDIYVKQLKEVIVEYSKSLSPKLLGLNEDKTTEEAL